MVERMADYLREAYQLLPARGNLRRRITMLLADFDRAKNAASQGGQVPSDAMAKKIRSWSAITDTPLPDFDSLVPPENADGQENKAGAASDMGADFKATDLGAEVQAADSTSRSLPNNPALSAPASECGFDRNASISEDRYVCSCGREEHNSPRAPENADGQEKVAVIGGEMVNQPEKSVAGLSDGEPISTSPLQSDPVPSAPASETPATEVKELRDKVLEERENGNLVFWGLPGQLMAAKLDEFIEQPAEGILYDLNRLEEVSLTFLADPKWVNDFAVALVIRKLKDQLNALRSRLDAAEKDKTVWFVERENRSKPPVPFKRWLASWNYEEPIWTNDPLFAIRFARKEDAEETFELPELRGLSPFASEHSFINAEKIALKARLDEKEDK